MAQVTVSDTFSESQASSSQWDTEQLNVSSGEVLFVAVILEVVDANKEVTGIRWLPFGANEALEFFAAISPSHGKLRIEIWQLTTPEANATGNFRTTIEDNQKGGFIGVSVANVDTTTPLSDTDSQDGSGNSGSVAVTQGADDLAFCFAAHLQNADAFGIGGSEDEHEDFDGDSFMRGWAASEDGSGATTLSWTQTEEKERATIGFNIKAAAAAGAAHPFRRPTPNQVALLVR